MLSAAMCAIGIVAVLIGISGAAEADPFERRCALVIGLVGFVLAIVGAMVGIFL